LQGEKKVTKKDRRGRWVLLKREFCVPGGIEKSKKVKKNKELGKQ